MLDLGRRRRAGQMLQNGRRRSGFNNAFRFFLATRQPQQLPLYLTIANFGQYNDNFALIPRSSSSHSKGSGRCPNGHSQKKNAASVETLSFLKRFDQASIPL